jgi:LysM repeat protein
MPTTHEVQQGEYLASIATGYGVAAQVIWDDPSNAKLKQKRQNPNVLFPGDKLTIPDKASKAETGETGKRLSFRLNTQPLKLLIMVKDSNNKPLANTDCTLQIDSKEFKLKTDGDGKIEQEIPAIAKEGSLTVLDVTVPLKIGHLDPVEEKTGQMARLNNLGYNAGAIDNVDEQQFLSAVEEFQCDHKLMIDGVCGKNTQAKLREVHGS